MRSSYFILLAVFFCSGLSLANVIGSDAQNFSPTQDGIDFVTVHSSETLELGILNFGFYLNYAQNTFPAFEGSGQAPSQSLLDKNDSITSADINFALGIFDDFQLGVSFPYIIQQSIENSQNLGRFEGSGISEIRPAVKYSFLRTQTWGLATAFSANFNHIENNPYVGRDAGPTWNFELIADRVFGKWNWALNLGHRWRDRGETLPSTGIDPLPDQWVYSTALSYLFTSIDTKLIGEIYGSTPKYDTPNLSNRQNSSLEALLGVKHDITRSVAAHVGFGTELAQGTSTPDWRVYSGINIVLGPLYGEREGIRERRVREQVNFTLTNLQFKFNSAELTAESKATIDVLVKRVRKLKRANKLRIEGHTDSVGPEEYNQQLSEKRAQTIRKILIEQVPMSPDKVEAVGIGEAQPIADNGNFQGRQKNRRVEIKVE